MASNTTVKRVCGAGIAVGACVALWRAYQSRRSINPMAWETHPFPFPPTPVVSETPAPAWVAPSNGACPPGYPVKAKLASGIFHVPGGQNYDRTVPDRCYRDGEGAVADGLRASKR